MVFSESKYFFSLCVAAELLFRDKFSQHRFFLRKQVFYRHKVLSKYCFLTMSETGIFFSIKFADKNLFSKNDSPHFKLNGRSLNVVIGLGIDNEIQKFCKNVTLLHKCVPVLSVKVPLWTNNLILIFKHFRDIDKGGR